MSAASSGDGPLLVLYPDTAQVSGFGHIARCYALAEAWVATGGRVGLVAPDGLAPGWLARFEALDARIVPVWSGRVEGWALLDDYAAGPGRQQQVGSRSRLLAVVDDHGSIGRYEADLVIDQNLGADPTSYGDCRAGALLLAGSSYALVREEFRRVAVNRFPTEARRVLVALGGSPQPSALALIESVAGRDALSALDWRDLTGRGDVAAEMAASDLAVSASGVTAWELCCVGVPMVLISLADNQEPVGSRLQQAGAALYLGPYERLAPNDVAEQVDLLARDRARRKSMARAARGVVDGRGAARVVAEMRGRLLEVRSARREDAELLFRWVNDPAVRAASFVTDHVAWDDHLAWFDARLTAEESRMYIVSYQDQPIAQIRFDCLDSVAEIGFSVDRQSRSAGWAAPVLIAGARRVVQDRSDVTEVRGVVKPENQRSASAFEAAGFRPEERRGDTDDAPLRYIRRRDALLI